MSLETASARDFAALFDPCVVALVGASDDPAKWGFELARALLLGQHRRVIHLVNRGGKPVLGHATFRSLNELPDDPDLVVVAVPSRALDSAIDDALARRARAIVVISAGFAESDADGARRQARLAERVRAAGAMLVGPNCLGVVDTHSELVAAGWSTMARGSIGVVSQSGNVGLEIGRLAAQMGLGVSRFVSLGNQSDLSLTELVGSFAEHDPTRVLAIYCEDFRDGRAFIEAMALLRAAGKSAVVLAAGGSQAGARAARSHTGSLASDLAVVDAALRSVGAIRVTSPRELVEQAAALLTRTPFTGRRVGVLSDGGGHAVVAAEVLTAAGLEVVPFSAELVRRIGALLPAGAGIDNPIDLGPANLDPRNVRLVAELILTSAEIDTLVLTGFFGGGSGVSDELGRLEAEVGTEVAALARAAGVPLVAHTMFGDSPAADALREADVPVFADIGCLAQTLGRATVAHRMVTRELVTLPAVSQGSTTAWDYAASRSALAGCGVPFVEAHEVVDLDEALAAARAIGFPVVLKALGRLHKSDAGGVAVDLPDPDSLRAAFDDMLERLSPSSFSVERMARVDGGIELIVGARWDAHFGPAVMVGFGGIHTELLGDVVVELAPVDSAAARAMLERLRGAALLGGARGAPALDIAAATDVIVAVSDLAARLPSVREMEINPLLLGTDGAVALDARIVS